MENTFENISWENIGIEIDDLEKTLENPDTVSVPSGTIKHDWVDEGKPVWKPKSKFSNGRKVFWVVVVMISIAILLVSSMAANAGMDRGRTSIILVED